MTAVRACALTRRTAHTANRSKRSAISKKSRSAQTPRHFDTGAGQWQTCCHAPTRQ
jgi:hypothetical protein